MNVATFHCGACHTEAVGRTETWCPNCRQPLARFRRPGPPPARDVVDDATTELSADEMDVGREAIVADSPRAGPQATRRESGAGEYFLHCPWGEVPVSGTLAIGRDPEFSRLAPHLDEYTNVSREHAEVFREAGELVVRDVGSMNGTFLNDEQLAEHVPAVVRDGDVLRLGRDVELRVEQRATRP